MPYQPKLYRAGETPPRRTGGIVRLFGFKGVGKTTVAINSSDVAQPLFFNNFDRSASHLLKGYTGEAGYFYEEYNKADSKAEAKVLIDKLQGMANAACNLGSGVFVIDNEANEWSLVKRAFLPEAGKEPLPREYDDANEFQRNLLLALESAGIWVVLTAPAKQVWFGAKTDSVEGEKYYVPEGWKHTEYMALTQVWLHLSMKPLGAVALPDGGQFEYTYRAQYIDAKLRPAVEGMVVDNPTFRDILTAVKAL